MKTIKLSLTHIKCRQSGKKIKNEIVHKQELIFRSQHVKLCKFYSPLCDKPKQHSLRIQPRKCTSIIGRQWVGSLLIISHRSPSPPPRQQKKSVIPPDQASEP